MSQRIQKVVISGYGDPSNIKVVTAEIDPPPVGHVQVRIIYCGFSGADINMRQGTYPNQRRAPFTPGYAITGIVQSEGAATFKPGDYVACLTKYDGQAELVNLPEKYLVPVAKDADLQKITAIILDWTTAYAMVNHSANIKSGQRVFIHGMSGAVGYALVVLSKLNGAEVYGTSSERNHAELRSLGANPFAYSNKDWIAAMKELGGVDAVFDALSFESWDESYSILNRSGIMVGYGANLRYLQQGVSGWIIVPFLKLFLRKAFSLWRGKTASFYLISRDDAHFKSDLLRLFELQKLGEITIPIKKVFDMHDIQEAHSSWGKIQGMGSILIRVAKDA